MLVKYLLAFFVCSMTLQPVGLPACGMQGEMDAADHHGMAVVLAEEADGHAIEHGEDGDGCCDASSGGVRHDCEMLSHCGVQSPVSMAIPPKSDDLAFTSSHPDLALVADRYSGPPDDPLYRPPIT